ncbi:MAG: hypothetical protein NWE99_07205 [Candidatus Bathyarchaeota archaeon]|nr:hypothetical protein [Candidatus Bathyarchaeota archaeon]
MEVDELAMPKQQAEAEFNALKQALRQNSHLRKEQIRRDMCAVYGHLHHGKKIIDIYTSFQKAGLNKDGDPKLAICRADAKQCYCYKFKDGSAVFADQRWITAPRKTFGDIKLPAGTFKWPPQRTDIPMDNWQNDIKGSKNIQTPVPIIPAKILVNEVKILLKNYHILWEVEEWKPEPPRDPILLKQLTPNLFGVLATWDPTPLERAIIRGRTQ